MGETYHLIIGVTVGAQQLEAPHRAGCENRTHLLRTPREGDITYTLRLLNERTNPCTALYSPRIVQRTQDSSTRRPRVSLKLDEVKALNNGGHVTVCTHCSK